MSTTSANQPNPQRLNGTFKRFAVGVFDDMIALPLDGINVLLQNTLAHKGDEGQPNSRLSRLGKAMAAAFDTHLNTPTKDRVARFFERNGIQESYRMDDFCKCSDPSVTWGHRVGITVSGGPLLLGAGCAYLGKAVINKVKGLVPGQHT